MKFRKILLLVVGIWTFAACVDRGDVSPAAADPEKEVNQEDLRPYGYRSGIVEFLTRKPLSEVAETVYFAEWGRLEIRKETFRSPLGDAAGPPRHQITLINRKGVFTYQVETGEGLKSPPLPASHSFTDYDALKARLGEEAAIDHLRKMGIEKLPDEVLLGFSCQGFRRENVSFWMHRGLALRSSIRIGDFSIERHAVRFVPDVTVDQSRFQFPKGVDPEKFKSVTDLLKKSNSEAGPGKLSS